MGKIKYRNHTVKIVKFQAAIEACKILNGRLSEVKKKVGSAATWLEIVQAANMANVDLCARYM